MLRFSVPELPAAGARAAVPCAEQPPALAAPTDLLPCQGSLLCAAACPRTKPAWPPCGRKVKPLSASHAAAWLPALSSSAGWAFSALSCRPNQGYLPVSIQVKPQLHTDACLLLSQLFTSLFCSCMSSAGGFILLVSHQSVSMQSLSSRLFCAYEGLNGIGMPSPKGSAATQNRAREWHVHCEMTTGCWQRMAAG